MLKLSRKRKLNDLAMKLIDLDKLFKEAKSSKPKYKLCAKQMDTLIEWETFR